MREETVESTATVVVEHSPAVTVVEKVRKPAKKTKAAKAAKVREILSGKKTKPAPKKYKPVKGGVAEVKAKPAKVKAPKQKRERVKPVGPGTKKFRFKSIAVTGQCDVLDCKAKAYKPTARRCAPHKKAIRKVQLAANNIIWKQRRDEGQAGHHLVYTVGNEMRATEWSRMNPERALKLSEEGGSTVTPATLKKLIAESEKAHRLQLRDAEAKRKEAAKKRSETMKAKKAPKNIAKNIAKKGKAPAGKARATKTAKKGVKKAA